MNVKKTNRVFGEYFLKISVHKNRLSICYKFLNKHSTKVDLRCLNPGNGHFNNLMSRPQCVISADWSRNPAVCKIWTLSCRNHPDSTSEHTDPLCRLCWHSGRIWRPQNHCCWQHCPHTKCHRPVLTSHFLYSQQQYHRSEAQFYHHYRLYWPQPW